MAHQNDLTRLGGASAMLGVAISFAAVAIGPMLPDPHDVSAVLGYFAAAPERLHLHGFGVTLGTLLLLGGFATLARCIRSGVARSWAHLGLAAAVVMTVVHLIGPVMGGAVLPTLGRAFVTSAPEEASATLHAAGAFYVFYEALLAPTLLTLAVTGLHFSRALVVSSEFPAWLGWLGVMPAAWAGVGGFAFMLVGPLGAAGMLAWFMPALMLVMAWVFVVGAVMWRSAAP